jgi:cell division protein FtsX
VSRSLLPTGGAATAWAGPALSLLALLGALLAILGAAAIRQGSPSDSRLAGAAVVVVWGHGLESADAAQARAAEILTGIGGVERATSLDPGRGDEQLARSLGAPSGAAARLVAVVSPAAHVAAKLDQVLRAQGIAGRAGDRDAAAHETRKALFLALAGDVVLPALIVLAMVAVCGWAVRWEANLSAASLALIRQFGASDGFIRGLWRRRGAGRGFVCGLIGAASAVIVALIWQARGGLGVEIGSLDLIWAGPWVLIAGLIGALTTPGVAR